MPESNEIHSMKLQIVKNRKYNYIFSVVLFVVSVVALVTWGLKPGLDFTGGSLMELSFEPNRPESAQIEEIAMKDERLLHQLAGNKPKKMIIVPKKIINIVF